MLTNNNTGEQTMKQAAKLSLAFMALLLIGALVFCKERMLFGDPSYALFNVIRYNSFAIFEHRYGAFISQLFPWIGQKLNLPVSVLLIGYSLSFNLFYLIVAALLVYRYRQYMLAIIMALYYCLQVSDSFFWPSNEIHQAIGWMFLFYGMVLSSGAKHRHIVVTMCLFLPLAFLTIYTHFVAIIPLFFIWVFLWVNHENWPFSRAHSILLTCLFFVVILAKYISTDSSYDSSHIGGVTHANLQDALKSLSTPVIAMFLYRCLINYWAGVLLFAAGLFGLFRQRKIVLAVWSICSCIGYFALIGLTYGDLDSSLSLYHIEAEWQCLSIILAMPFVVAVLPRLKPRTGILLLAAVFAVRIIYISQSAPKFIWRSQFRENVLAQMRKKNINKLALIVDPETRGKYLNDWTLQDESIISSLAHGDVMPRTFRFADTNDHVRMKLYKDPRYIDLSLESVFIQNIHCRYYPLDSTHPYQVLTYEELFNNNLGK